MEQRNRAFARSELLYELSRRTSSAAWGQMGLVTLFVSYPYLMKKTASFNVAAMISIFLLSLMRMILARQYLAKTSELISRNFIHIFNVTVCAAGFSWGFFVGDIYRTQGLASPESLMVSIILAGVLAASTNSLMPRLESFLLFAVPALGVPFVRVLLGESSTLESLVASTFVLNLLFLIGIARNSRRDLIERLESISRLHGSTYKMHRMLNGFPGLVSHFNERLEYLFVNEFFEADLNIKKELVLGREVGCLEVSGDFERLLRWFQRDEQKVFSSEVRALTKRGFETHLCTLSKIDDGEIIAVSVNLEELKHTQNLVEGHAKMALLGVMAAGIGHEINNPLAIAGGQLQMLRRKARGNGVLTSAELEIGAEKINKSIERIAKIVRGLRALSRDEKLTDVASTTLKDIFQDTLSLVDDQYKSAGVKLEISECPQVLLHCNAVQISQVILNLLVNACQAVQFLKEPWVKVNFRVVGSFVEILISDSGAGIPEDIREKIFQPFFTTKEVGKGTGLGLSLSINIVRSHGGSLSLNTQSKNTEFVVSLPCEVATSSAAA